MPADGKTAEVAAHFDGSHANRLRSPTLERLWQAAYGDEYPAGVQPNAFYSFAILQRLADALALRKDQTLVDLGCGHGGAGLWMVQQRGSTLFGIDISPGGIALALSRAAELGLQERSRFQVGDMLATGLPDASCDAAMSLDALLFAPDPAAALRETARILRPNGRFGFTSWEQHGSSQRLDAPQLGDYRPILEQAGFDVEVYDEPPNWRQQQRTLLEDVVAHEHELAKEMERTAWAQFASMARGALEDMPSRRYVFGIARRRVILHVQSDSSGDVGSMSVGLRP